jgi:hypothetical protein
MSLYVNLISTYDDTGLKKAGTGLTDGEKQLESFKLKANAAFAAAGAAAVAYAGKLLKDGVQAAIEDERAQVKLAGALRNVTGATEDQIAATEDFILQTSLATGVADDKLRPAFERLVRSTKDVEEAQNLTNLALDIAAGTGKDVTTVANALAKANDGSVTSLKKLGISIGENTTTYGEYIKESDKLVKLQNELAWATENTAKGSDEYKKALENVKEQQSIVNDFGADSIDWVSELGKEFSGAAAEGADTFEGKLARMQVTFDEAKESVGALVLDGLQPLLDFIMDLVDGWNKLNPNVQNAVMVFGLASVAIIGAVVAVTKMIAIFNTLKATYAVITAAQIGLNVAMFTNPIFLVIAAIVALIAIFVVAYHKIDWFRAFVDKAFTQVKEWIVGAANAVKTAWDKVWQFFETLKPKAVTIFKAIANAITAPFRAAFNKVAEFWNNTIGKFKITIPDWVPLIGGKTFEFPKMPKIPELADGGIVKARNGGTLALIGEGGRDEAVIPLPKGMRKDGIMGGGITINVSGALDPEAVARQIETILKRSTLRAGAY